jgi:hypothetical protein
MTGTSDPGRFTARAYLASRGDLDSRILDAGTAVEQGRATFGSLVTSDPR